jgi:hypothetical protein
MPAGNRSSLGNELFEQAMYVTGVTFPTLAANASSTTAVTLNGVLPGDAVTWNMQAPAAHLTIDNIYVSAANTLQIQWGTDGTGVTGASNLNVLMTVARPENSSLGITALPASLT